MSDTPRTDAVWDRYCNEMTPAGQFVCGPWDLADHARDLERECARLRDVLADAAKFIAPFSSGTANGRSEKLKRRIAAALAGKNDGLSHD